MFITQMDPKDPEWEIIRVTSVDIAAEYMTNASLLIHEDCIYSWIARRRKR